MASASNSDSLNAAGLVTILLFGVAAAGQTPLTLEEAAARTGRDFRPLYEGREVILRGRVSVGVIPVVNYAHLAIQDDAGYGFTIESQFEELARFSPGESILAWGTIGERAGLPVLRPEEIRSIDKGSPAEPRRIPLEKLNSFRYQGVYVMTEGSVRSVGVNEGGHFLLLGNRDRPVKVFLPYKTGQLGEGLSQFRVGDLVRVTGVSSQYTPLPPFNRFYQLTVSDAGAVELIERPWPIPMWALFTALGLLAAAIGIWWVRERHMSARRRKMRRLYQLGEEMVAALSAEESLRILKGELPETLRITSVRMYLYDHGAKRLRVVEESGASAASGSWKKPGLLVEAAETCWKNRSLLLIPDMRQNPFYSRDDALLPKAAMFVPMFAQGEPLGVLEINDARRHRQFNADEQAVVQHLANQLAIGIELRERQSIRDQLFRSEKLAATGQLISSTASELKTPLEEIELAASKLRSDGIETATISSKARQAAAVVDRLLTFTQWDDESTSFDIGPPLRALLKSRDAVWKERGIRLASLLSAEPVMVSCSLKHLEQVLLSLLAHAEASAAKTIMVREIALAHGAQIEIVFRDPGSAEGDAFLEKDDSEGGLLGLGVCRSILRSQGGDLRIVKQSDGFLRLEVELRGAPATGMSNTGMAADNVRVTALVVEPDSESRRRITALLSEAGHRAVSASTADEAVEFTGRFPFQAIFCSTRLAGTDCVELLERTRDRVDAFVFLGESYGGESTQALPHGEGYILTKPVNPDDFARVVHAIQGRIAARVR